MLTSQLFDIKNKVVVVTGASGFIGSEISCSLAEVGCKVTLLFNNNSLRVCYANRYAKTAKIGVTLSILLIFVYSCLLKPSSIFG